MTKYSPQLGPEEWRGTLERLVEWADFLGLNPPEAFRAIANILANEHFGVESTHLDNFEDMSPDDPPSMEYLNMGDAYATTLVLTDDYCDGVKLLVTTWGDWLESVEQFHMKREGYIRCCWCGHFTSFDYDHDDYHAHDCEHCGNCVSGDKSASDPVFATSMRQLPS